MAEPTPAPGAFDPTVHQLTAFREKAERRFAGQVSEGLSQMARHRQQYRDRYLMHLRPINPEGIEDKSPDSPLSPSLTRNPPWIMIGWPAHRSRVLLRPPRPPARMAQAFARLHRKAAPLIPERTQILAPSEALPSAPSIPAPPVLLIPPVIIRHFPKKYRQRKAASQKTPAPMTAPPSLPLSSPKASLGFWRSLPARLFDLGPRFDGAPEEKDSEK